VVDYLYGFSEYLTETKRVSQNTYLSYMRDITQYLDYLKTEGLDDPCSACVDTVSAYFQKLEQAGKSDATIVRNSATLRCFYKFLRQKGLVDSIPVHMDMPRHSEKQLPEILTNREIELLLRQPDVNDPKGCRDKAILEILYATGVRVSELISLNVKDVNTELNFVRCSIDHNERMVPLYPAAAGSIRAYLQNSRVVLVDNPAENALFVNVNGERITRQGLWKIIRQYAVSAGIQKKITPQMLRHSFAVHLLENGVDLKSLQEMMGHADISSTQVYANIIKKRLSNMYGKKRSAN